MDGIVSKLIEGSWSPVSGCSPVSAGCMNCPTLVQWDRLSARPGSVYHGRAVGDVLCHPERLSQPLYWRRQPRQVTVNPMSDLFHPDVPDTFLDEVFAVMALAQQHVFKVLTKRPERMLAYASQLEGRRDLIRQAMQRITIWMPPSERAHLLPVDRFAPTGGLPNVWLGVSVEDQSSADQRVPLLLQTPAAVRWVCAEPLLGMVDLTRFLRTRLREGDPHDVIVPALDWVVVGGETGHDARAMNPEWVRELRDQCVSTGVPFLFKQWGTWVPDRSGSTEPASLTKPVGMYAMTRPGSPHAGRWLDGQLHNGFPAQRAPNAEHTPG